MYTVLNYRYLLLYAILAGLLIVYIEGTQSPFGDTAEVGQFPSWVSIRVIPSSRSYLRNVVPTYNKTRHLCSGSIISPTWILTAAHCLWWSDYQPSASEIGAVAGMGRMIPYVNVPAAYKRRALSYRIHEGFVKHRNKDDIAVIEVANWTFSSSIASIPYSASKFPLGISCVLLGTKSRDPPCCGSTPEKLNFLNATIHPNQFCFDAMDEHYKPPSPHIYCVGGESELSKGGTCLGEQGSPLICYGMLVAMASRWIPPPSTSINGESKKNRSCPMPDLYTDLGPYADWISKSIAPQYPGECPACNTPEPCPCSGDVRLTFSEILSTLIIIPIYYMIS